MEMTNESRSIYRMQVIHNGQLVMGWAPGDRVETDIILDLCQRLQDKGLAPVDGTEKAFLDDLCERIEEKGVGMLKTQTSVVRSVRAAFREMRVARRFPEQISTLDLIREAWDELVLDLKKRV